MSRHCKTGGIRLFALLCVCCLLMGCSSGGFGGTGKGPPELQDPEYTRTPPPLLLPQTGENQTQQEDGENSAMIDTSFVSEGYVGASCTSASTARLRIASGSYQQDFFLDTSGKVEFFPLVAGNGAYTFHVLVVLPDGKSATTLLTAESGVTLSSEFAPFLVPNKTVYYDAGSRVVSLSHDISKHASSDLEVIQQVYYWVENNIEYDDEKANAILRGEIGLDYTPSPDGTIQARKGICYDYASLVAAMLRANGIPCQLVMGVVNSGEGGQLDHAWNLIWTEEEGWIAVEVAAQGKSWQRVDLTFAAAQDAGLSQFVGDGSNYAQMQVR